MLISKRCASFVLGAARNVNHFLNLAMNHMYVALDCAAVCRRMKCARRLPMIRVSLSASGVKRQYKWIVTLLHRRSHSKNSMANDGIGLQKNKNKRVHY